MVFQNYALYPHMTVYDNMAFSLKLRKHAKGDIDRRVQEAATIWASTICLIASHATSPAGSASEWPWVGLSCGNPQAFLMDEPLSNLDAKLRVQMRAEIARIQDDSASPPST